MMESDDQLPDRGHEFDGDCVCMRCGFDGAEWWHWKKFTREGSASDAKQPQCTVSE